MTSLGQTVQVEHEVIVVDDASEADTRAYLESLPPPFRLIRHDENQGFARSVNRGGREARADRVLFLNSDTVLASGWLEPMLKLLESDSSIGAVGNVQVNPGTGLVDHAGVLLTPGTLYNTGHDCFRIGFGRRNMPDCLEKFAQFIAK